MCFDINIIGLYNVLEVARNMGIKQIICPSSIAIFGPESPKDATPQETIVLPKTMYGVSKASGELLCDYYVEKYKMDIRGLRYPGLISYKTLPGGGTTDYAVEIFYEALKYGRYECFLEKNTTLPMMYMDDAIRGTLELAEADFSKLKHHSNFNFSAMSFSCEELANEIRRHLPNFKIEYKPDFRQNIANSWPKSIDDSCARNEWGWKEKFTLSKMVEDMILNLRKKI
jgi:nucleoside-diphosphate-sugar epimerase